ncbi:DMT family transporter [Paenibacillus alkalitolerans]|uniref:DMT family transporter n=1 Tax=Paenibacillus alkalitolerans TaxID=2799335 RepID=UPI0018F58BE8|nr:multidrug efflux SMR transporter [Paenibacillus alkalitolerans]
MNTAWIYVIVGGILEIGWAIGLKYTEGFTNRTVSVLTVAIIIASMYFFTKSMKLLPVGTAYAVYTGIGAAGTAIAGMMFLGEDAGAAKICFIILLLTGIIGLKLTSTEQSAGKTPQTAGEE